jgi:SSS family solute:Na+ symporter
MIPLIIIVVYLGILLWLTRFAHVGFSRKTAKDYFLASRSIGPFLLIMSVFGTTMTAFALVGSTGEAFRDGIGVYGLMASWSGIVHSLCFFLIGVKLWHFGNRFGYTTQIEFFRDRFQSSTLGLLLFPILVALVIPYLLIGILGGGATIEGVTRGAFPGIFPDTNGGVPHQLGAGMICAVVLIYVFGGGVRSTAWANAMQTCVFMVLGVITFLVIADKLGGLRAASEAVAAGRPDLLVRGPTEGHPGHIGHLRFLSYAFVPLSVAMFPHLFQHWMTARSAKAFRATVILHPIFIMIVWIPCVLIGVWSATAVYNGVPVIPPGLDNPNKVLAIVVTKLTNPYLTGLLTVGILAAIMSSLDSQFLCIGSMFTHDVVLHYWGKERFSDRARILLGRTFVVGIVLVSYLLSLAEPRSVFILGVWCFSGFAGLFPLVFASIYWRRTTKAGAIASVLAMAAAWLFLFRQSGWAGDDNYLFLGMMPVASIVAVSAVVLVAVSLLTRPPDKETLERFFSEKGESREPLGILEREEDCVTA